MANCASFTIAYPGAAASSNHGYATALRRSKRTGKLYMSLRMTPEAKAFKDEVTMLAKQAFHFAEWYPKPDAALTVRIRGEFPNKRHSDVHNLSKFILDGIEDALDAICEGGYNDRAWGLEVFPPEYREGLPTINVEVKGEHRTG